MLGTMAASTPAALDEAHRSVRELLGPADSRSTDKISVVLTLKRSTWERLEGIALAEGLTPKAFARDAIDLVVRGGASVAELVRVVAENEP